MSLQLDEIARLQADLDGGADRASTLRDAGVDEAAFRIAKLAMLDAMAADLDRGDGTMVQRYAAAFVGRAGTLVEVDTPEEEDSVAPAERIGDLEPIREVAVPSFLAQPAPADRGAPESIRSAPRAPAPPAAMPAPSGLAGTGFLDRDKMLAGLKLPFREAASKAPPPAPPPPPVAPPAPLAAGAPITADLPATPPAAPLGSPTTGLSTGTMMSSGPLPLPAAALPFAGGKSVAPKPGDPPSAPAPMSVGAPRPAAGVAFAMGVPTAGAVPATPGIGVTFMSPAPPRAAAHARDVPAAPPASMRNPVAPSPAPFDWTLETYASFTVDLQLGAREQVLAAYRLTVLDQAVVQSHWRAVLADPEKRKRCDELAEQYRIARYGR